jgi:outer membrane protein assembly factor BamB
MSSGNRENAKWRKASFFRGEALRSKTDRPVLRWSEFVDYAAVYSKTSMKKRTSVLLTLATLSLAARPLVAADPPQFGSSPSRNNVSDAKNLPIEWAVGEFEAKTGRWLNKSAKNIRWAAPLGNFSYGSPVVADGKVFCATNNAHGYVAKYPAKVDLGCLLCFRQSDGVFLWQLSREKLGQKALDWPEVGICCSPLIEGKRLWTVTNRCEVLCLETETAPAAEPAGAKAGSAKIDKDGASPGEPRILWSFDMIAKLGVVPRNMSSCSVTAAGDLLLVNTSNGAEDTDEKIPAPQAPSFIALDKTTGKLLWSDNSPGANILSGQWASPAYAVIGGVPQAIFAGGDGWVYSFLAKPSASGKPELLWKFDCNPKASAWKKEGRGDRGTLVATPVIYENQVYIGTGEDPQHDADRPGHLWCIDATKRGDVSPELVFDKAGKPVPPRRYQAADAAAGDVVKPNPNSAAVWHYTEFDADGDGKIDFKEAMHRTLSTPAIKDGILIIPDLAGLIHCLDAKTGKVHWTHDVMSAIWGSPLIADGRVYLGNEDGNLVVFELSTKWKLLSPDEKDKSTSSLGAAIYTTPAAAGDVIYVSTCTRVVAIGAERK